VFAEGGHVPSEKHTAEEVWPKDTIYYEKTRLQHDDPTALAKAAMIRTERWKYVARLVGKEELYDLEADADELVNRIDDAGLSDVVVELRNQLLQWLLRTSDDVPFDQDPRR
jgi:arylsulfatase A-like enzyme